jgi:hypothetical protein
LSSFQNASITYRNDIIRSTSKGINMQATILLNMRVTVGISQDMPEFAKSITAIDICLEKVVAGGERGTIVPPRSHTIADALVPHSWHKTVAALFECTGIFLLLSCYQDGKSIYRLVNPLLAGRGRCPPGCTNSHI